MKVKSLLKVAISARIELTDHTEGAHKYETFHIDYESVEPPKDIGNLHWYGSSAHLPERVMNAEVKWVSTNSITDALTIDYLTV